MGCLDRATFTVYLISAQTSQEGIKCAKDKEYFRSYCPNIYTLGTGLGSKAVVEVTKEKSVRVDGVIIDSPFHSFEYALEKMPNFYYYSSFFIDWSKFLEVAGLKVHTANVTINVLLTM